MMIKTRSTNTHTLSVVSSTHCFCWYDFRHRLFLALVILTMSSILYPPDHSKSLSSLSSSPLVLVQAFMLIPATTRTTTGTVAVRTATTTRAATTRTSRYSQKNSNIYSSSSSFPSSSSFRSKRQERIGQVLQKELSEIFHSHIHEIKMTPSFTSSSSSYTIQQDALLFKRLTIVRVDVSPDLRQAKVVISLVQGSSSSSSSSTTTTNHKNQLLMDRRRIYSLVVQYTKQIRHALSQRVRHWKILPTLSFEQVNVGAAVDVMILLNQIQFNKDNSGGLKRAKIGKYGGDDDSLPPIYLQEDDDDEEDDDLVWLDDPNQEIPISQLDDEDHESEEMMDEDDNEEEDDDDDQKSSQLKNKKKKTWSDRRRRQYRIEDL